MSSGDLKEMFDAAVQGNMAVLRYHLLACILANPREAVALLLKPHRAVHG